MINNISKISFAYDIRSLEMLPFAKLLWPLLKIINIISRGYGHFGPKDRTGHQKDRSAHAIRQLDVGVGMHVHRRHGVIMTFEATMGTGDVTLDADA